MSSQLLALRHEGHCADTPAFVARRSHSLQASELGASPRCCYTGDPPGPGRRYGIVPVSFSSMPSRSRVTSWGRSYRLITQRSQVRSCPRYPCPRLPRKCKVRGRSPRQGDRPLDRLTVALNCNSATRHGPDGCRMALLGRLHKGFAGQDIPHLETATDEWRHGVAHTLGCVVVTRAGETPDIPCDRATFAEANPCVMVGHPPQAGVPWSSCTATN
jgi:hypothetical protein